MITGNKDKPSMYGLSTCGWCAKARAWLDANVQSYDLVYVDLLSDEERQPIMSDLQKRVGSQIGFPVIFFGDEFVMGYNPEEYERLTKAAQ
jgi:glutaredoxin-like protein NrdH